MEICRLNSGDYKEVKRLYASVTAALLREGNKQWDRFYPNRFIIKKDIGEGKLYGIKRGNAVVAAVAVDRKQSGAYSALAWADAAGNPACIHRLAVHPSEQGKGLGKALLLFAELHAFEEGFTSIRLDVYSGNSPAVNMYKRAGFTEVGTVCYPFRKLPYYCFEKMLTSGNAG